MKPKNTSMLFGLAVLLIFASAACSTEVTVPEEVVAAPAEPAPEEVIENFLHWYAAYPGNPLADGVLASSPVVTEGLVQKVEAVLASFDNSPGGYDPILCAQDRPQDFRVEIMDRSLDSASAVVHTEFEGHKIYVGVLKVDGEWMIADLSCASDPSQSLPQEDGVIEADTPTPIPTIIPTERDPEDEESGDEASQNDPTASWPIFRDEAYGFQIAYPPGWGFMDLPVYDPGAGRPPTVIKRFVILYPQEWEERLRPGGEPDPSVPSYPALTIEISLGTMEAYRREYIELGSSETVEINGLTALYEQDTYDDYNMTRYVFQHPTNDELRVTLSDPISGFSVRAEEDRDVMSLIPLVVSTFAFTE